jgi:hypothetical protein
MTLTPLQTVLGDMHPLYLTIQATRAEWEDLQSVEQALADHDTLIGAEQAQFDALKEQRANLVREKQRLERRQHGQPSGFGGGSPFGGMLQRTRTGGRGDDQREPPPAAVQGPADSAALRQRLKKMVGQLRHLWQLDGETVGRINRIADDASRPLGEALALLDWRLYETEIFRGEEADAHLKRLELWQPELAHYLRFLEGEISARRNRYRNVIPIWEQWRRQEATYTQSALDLSAVAETCDLIGNVVTGLIDGGALEHSKVTHASEAHAGEDVAQIHGVSIYWPRQAYDPVYEEMDFVRSRWNQLIKRAV